MGALLKFYLIVYNIACCIGWGMVLNICFQHIKSQSLDGFWTEVEQPLKIVQTAALLEIFHSMTGMVKSPWFTTLLQVFSRVWVLWAVMDVSPAVHSSWFILLCATSWGLVEVPRYLFYALNIVNMVPYPLFWLRYSLFAILYPTGISGELGCTYVAGKWLYETAPAKFIWTPVASMPDVKITLWAILLVMALSYIPGSPKMYMHMVKTRKNQFELHDNPELAAAKKQAKKDKSK